MSNKRIILSTSALNRKGYRVLTAGVRLQNFLKNPVMLFDHQSWRIPVGMWEDLKVEGDEISALPRFDENDLFGQALKYKYDNGFPLAASIGFDPIRTSEETQYLVQGQRYASVIESDLLEASITPVPGNSDATMTLSYDAPHTLSAIPPISQKSQPDMDFKKITAALGLPEGADESAVIAAIGSKDEQIKTLSAIKVEGLLALGETNGAVTADNKEQWRKLAAADFDSTAALIKAAKLEAPKPAEEQKPKGQLITGMLRAGNTTPKTDEPPSDGRDGWTFDEWSKKDSKGLLQMKKHEPERYAKLAAEMYEKS